MHTMSLGPARRLAAALALALLSVPTAVVRADRPGPETNPTEVPHFTASALVVTQSRAYAPAGATESVTLKSVAAKATVAERAATVTLEIALESSSADGVTCELLTAIPRRSTLRETSLADTGATVKARVRRGKNATALWTAAARHTGSLEPLEFVASDAVWTAPVAVSREHPARVRIVYETALADTADRVDFTLPRSVGPAAAEVDWDVAVKAYEERPIAAVFSPSHDVSTERKGESDVEVGVAGAMAPGPVSLSFLLGAGRPVATFFTFPDAKADGGYFLMLGAMPNCRTERKAPLREVLFVVDRSSSMNGEKIEQAKRALLKSIRALRDGEAFNIIDYGSEVRRFSQQTVVKNAETAALAEQYISRIAVSGGTNLNDALVGALQTPPLPNLRPLVMFVTDGMPTEGVVDEAKIRANARDANFAHRQIYTIGIGLDVNAPLLAALAESSSATAAFIKPGESVEAGLSEVFERTGAAALTKARVEGAPGAVVDDVFPARLGDLVDGEEFVVVGHYVGSGSIPVRLAGEAGDRPEAYDFMIEPAAREDAFVVRAWAYRKAASIVQAVADAGGEDQAPADLSGAAAEIVRLAVEYGALTEVTGFLVEPRTNLTNRDELTELVSDNLARVASGERYGARAVGQTVLLRQQQRQFSAGNSQPTGQPICYVRDTSLVKRDQKWIDLRLLGRGASKAESLVKIDSAGLEALRDTLVKQRRCGVFAFPGALFEVDGKAIEIGTTAAKR